MASQAALGRTVVKDWIEIALVGACATHGLIVQEALHKGVAGAVEILWGTVREDQKEEMCVGFCEEKGSFEQNQGQVSPLVLKGGKKEIASVG